MRQIIPFKKELPFKTKVSEITSISLERDIKIEEEGIVTGIFHITGDYKMNEGSINRESFSFDIPFDITLDPRYDTNTVSSDIEDFYYDVLNEDTLKVNIDLFVEAEYLPEKEIIEERTTTEEIEEPRKIEIQSIPEEIQIEKVITEEQCIEHNITEEIPDDYIEVKNIKSPATKNIEDMDTIPALTADLFSNLDNTETYTTYYVYIVKEDDTIDKILAKYKVTKEDLESYNDITQIKPGDKIIVPKTSEE